ncbi:hypothetical protein [Paraglaciecola sp. 2405UD69-4]|uniref:hypothetical protein n=1 Tax=Paraglaciecola sp. 2405UD69-4 TaxID=3391836 RepID=UPI0039C99507
MENEEFKVIGGSYEKSINGDTKLDLKSLAKEAWELTKKGKSEVMQGVALMLFILMVFVWALQSIFGITDMTTVTPRTQVIMELVFVVITAPIVAAMLLIGISRSVGLKPEFVPLLKRAFGSFIIVLLALLLAVLTDVVGQVLSLAGLLLGVVATFYLGMATSFSMMLLIEKQLPPKETIVQSFKVFNRHWPSLSLFYIGSMVLFLLGMLSLGVAYIWLIPFYFNFKGVLYRDLFGINVSVNTYSPKQESVFNA